MSRKDYIALSDAICAAKTITGSLDDLITSAALRTAAERIADACKMDNPRFDRSRFLTACGFGSQPAAATAPGREPIGAAV